MKTIFSETHEEKASSAFSLSLLFALAVLLVYLHILYAYNEGAIFLSPYFLLLYFLAIFSSPHPALSALLSQLGALCATIVVAPLIYLYYPEYMSYGALFLQGDFYVFLTMGGVVLVITLLWNVLAGFFATTRARRELRSSLPALQINPEEGLTFAEIRQLPKPAKPHFLYGDLQWALIEKYKQFCKTTSTRTKWILAMVVMAICALWYAFVLVLLDSPDSRYERDRERVAEWSESLSDGWEYMQQVNALDRMIQQQERFAGKSTNEVREMLGLGGHDALVKYYFDNEEFAHEYIAGLGTHEKLLFALWDGRDRNNSYALIAVMDAAGEYVQKLRLIPCYISRNELTRFTAQQDLLNQLRP